MSDRLQARSATPVPFVLPVMLLAILSAACGPKVPSKSSSEYRDTVKAFYVGLAALQAGDDRRAGDELMKAAQLAPGEPAIWANLGMLSLKQREFDTAAQRLEKASKLAPENSRIVLAQATLASSRGNPADATKYLRRAIELDPKNLRAAYSLAEELERQGGDSNEAEAQRLLRQIVQIQPGNLAVLLEVTRLAAKRGDSATLRDMVSRIAANMSAWPPEAREQFTALQNAALETDTHPAGQRVAFLRNVLVRFPGYRTGLASVKLPPGEIGEPFVRFLKMASPSPVPAPADAGLAFTEDHPGGFDGAKWSWAGTVSLDGEGTPVIVVANASEVRVKGATLSFPG
ncbi:MAG TPA: tetratricopeptide repeat protein, partial [Blastocatellia bacterium]|nr:tetratricopeptide repeat protein [Blastocatellia bacterium]